MIYVVILYVYFYSVVLDLHLHYIIIIITFSTQTDQTLLIFYVKPTYGWVNKFIEKCFKINHLENNLRYVSCSYVSNENYSKHWS